jgi:citrate synthase
MLWLLLTGKIPSQEQTRQLSRELAEQAELSSTVEDLIDSLVLCLVERYHLTLLSQGYPALYIL